jgi:beta-barrel assembly-enhancing protease
MRERAGEFAGGVFSAELEGGRAGVVIRLESAGLVAETPAGQRFQAPYDQCELSRGGASEQMWFCRTREPDLTIFSEARGFAGALKTAGGAALAAQFAQLEGELAREGKRRRRVWSAVLGATLLVLAGGYWGLRRAGRASVTMLPASVDEQLGELAIEHMDLQGPVIEDAVLRAGIERVVQRLSPAASASGFKFQFRVVDAPIVNAFALPGGQVVVYTGLLRAAQSPEQLAGVLAHEMAHVTRRHGMQRIAQSLGVVAAVQLLFGDVSGVAAVAVEVLRQGAINSYSRDQEHEADMDAVHTLARAHVDPRALADFFAVLEKREGNLPTLVAWLGTHPELSQRIRDVRAQAQKQPKTAFTPLLDDWAEIQRHAGKMP